MSSSEHDSSHPSQETGPAGGKRKKHCAPDAGRRELLQSWLLRAWIGYRLRPNGKRRGKGEAMLNGSLLARSLLVVLGIASGPMAIRSTAAADPPASVPPGSAVRKPTGLRFLVPLIDVDNFGEGWKQTVRFATKRESDPYEIWVKDGWLHAKRTTPDGNLDWQITLAQVVGSDVPKMFNIDGTSTFELSYRDGRYFIRENENLLRCVRERAAAKICTPRSVLLGDNAKESGWSSTGWPQIKLSVWAKDEWSLVGLGPNDERFSAMVRLNPHANNPGFAVSAGGGLVRYSHGNQWLFDDGEMLVTERTLEANYKLGLAREQIKKNLPGSLPPKIEATAWINTKDDLSWETLKGKVVLVDFWGTWCGPCVKKLPAVQQFAEKYAGRELVVIGVHSQQGGETCQEFVEKNEISFPIAIDSGKTAEAFGIGEWPSLFLIDKAGKVVLGYVHDLPSDEVVEDLLKN
jgi:thiol-disulfide isomerase/thioredoxin